MQNPEPLLLSFSGSRSEIVARALHRLLSITIPSLRVFLSVENKRGKRWREELFPALQTAQFAIVCLTPENITAPWLHFEAGAISNLPESRVYTYLLGLHPDDIRGPLSEFQHTAATVEDTHDLIQQIGERIPAASSLDTSFEQGWHDFEKDLMKACRWQPPPKDERDVFWAPHRRTEALDRAPWTSGLIPKPRRTRLFYTEPRFWRYDRIFMRALDDNAFDESGDVNSSLGPNSQSFPEEMRPCVGALDFKRVHQFVSAGEAACLILLTNLLSDLGIRSKLTVSRHRKSWNDLTGDDLIVIGNARTHWAVQALQQGLDVTIDAKAIWVTRIERPFEDDPPGSDYRRVYAVVTRSPIRNTNYTATVLAANNGRAFEAVARYVSTAKLLRDTLKDRIDLSRPLPSSFQLLLKIELLKDDTAASDEPELVLARGFET